MAGQDSFEIGHGRAAASSWGDKRVQAKELSQRSAGSTVTPGRNCLSSAQAKSGRMAVMAHALKLVAAGDKRKKDFFEPQLLSNFGI